MEFNSFGPAVGRLGSDSSRGGAKLRQSRSRGAEPPPPLAPLTLTTAYGGIRMGIPIPTAHLLNTDVVFFTECRPRVYLQAS